MSSRRGYTLPEIVVALVIGAVVACIALRGASRLADGFATRGAARELRALLGTTRHLAVLRATRAAIRVDTARGVVTVHLVAETAAVRPIGALFGVRMTATRDSIAYAANGLGWGAANARFVVKRGSAAETVTVSRLGRVR